jgi:hypothetical protein
MITDEEIKTALAKVMALHGVEMAKTVERIFRNETAHFKSGGFSATLSPGMEATAGIFPYGWASLAEFWKVNANYSPSGTFEQVENSSKMLNSRGKRVFIKFRTVESSMMSVAHLIMLRGGDGARWFSNANTSDGEAYRAKYKGVLDSIVPRIVNGLVPNV